MFGKKTGEIKLQGPKTIHSIVEKYLIQQKKLDPELVQELRMVSKPDDAGSKKHAIRLFEELEAEIKKIQVKDYTTLDHFPNLIIYEGWYDEASKQVELAQNKIWGEPVKIYTLEEIQQKIEGLTDPGVSVYFYQARGPNRGGPLGYGANIVELNPDKKGKKYLVSTADVDGTEPLKGAVVMKSDKTKEIATWIKDAHHKRGLKQIYNG